MIFIIANPAAGRGKAVQALREVESARRNERASRILTTKAPGDEALFAREALRNGADTIVVVGGDGTCSKVAQEILSARQECALAIIPCGTGNDFAKTLGVANATAEEILGLVARANTSRIDVGRVDDRYFINSCGFGFDASVLEATKRVRVLTGDAVYVYSALRQLFTYPGVSVSVDSSPDAGTSKMLMVTISNGKFLGGAFRIAPDASVVDGKLDIGFFGDAGLVGRVRIFAGAFGGTHIGLPTVKTKRVSEMTLRFPAPPMMEVDGELRPALSSTVKIECAPRALSVVAAPGFPV